MCSLQHNIIKLHESDTLKMSINH